MKPRSLLGLRFGKLRVVSLAPRFGRRRGTCWWAVCDCGKLKAFPSTQLVSTGTRSCGCLKNSRIDILGQRFGKLRVVCNAPLRSMKTACWVVCDCGRLKAIRSSSLREGATRSCGICCRQVKSEVHKTVEQVEAVPKHGHTRVQMVSAMQRDTKKGSGQTPQKDGRAGLLFPLRPTTSTKEKVYA